MSIDAGAHFAPDYVSARERFRLATRRAGFRQDGHAIPTRAAGGGELSIDTAYKGPTNPESVLVVSSGVHGVEGFAGSAVQHRLVVEQLPGLDLPRSCGLLLVHAVNPYGFSALRRVNESNVDLNRNFVAHPDGHVENPGYEELRAAINPERLGPDTEPEHVGALLEYGEKHGAAKLQAVLTVGQYVHPTGVQFGGQRAEASNRALREIAVAETRGARRVVWIDVHTGLGPWGEVEMISESHPEDAEYRRARSWWGDAVRSTLGGESVSAHVSGSMESGLAEALEGRELTSVGAEFGTVEPQRVFLAMRADNWLHHHGRRDSEQGRAIKAELLEVFRPADPAWGARILEVADGFIAAARDGLAAR